MIDPRASPPNVSTTGQNFQDSSRIAVKYFVCVVITTDIWNQCLRNRERPNYIQFLRYVHDIVTCGPLSGIFLSLALIPCLLGWIQLFFLCSQITLTCLIKVVVKSKIKTSYKNLQEVLAINTSKSYRIIHNS